MTKEKVLYWLSVHTLIITGLLLSYVLYTLIYPFKIIQLNESPFRVDKHTYTQGESLTYTLNFTKYLGYKPKITYYLVDGFIYPLSRTGVSRPVGKQIRELSLVLPLTTPPGKYHIQIDFEYIINYFRVINYSWISEDFIVVKRETR